MIVRALLQLYPSPIKPEKILKLAFRKMRSPSEGSIRTHISKINKKLKIDDKVNQKRLKRALKFADKYSKQYYQHLK